MKSYLILLKMNLLNLLGGMRGASFRKPNGKRDFSRLFVFIVAALGIAVMAGSVVFLEMQMYRVAAGIGLEKLLFGLAVMLCMVTTVLFGVVHTLAALYFNRDSVSLAHLPLSPRAILAAKWTEIYLPEILLCAAFLLPLSILYGIDAGAGFPFYLRVAGLIITCPMYPLAIALLLCSVLGRATSFTRHKEAWVVLGTIVLVVVVIGGEMMLLPTIPEDADAMFFVRLLLNNEALMQTMIGAFPPVMWAVHTLMGNWGEWALFLGVAVAAMAAVLYLVGGDYLAVCLRHTEGASSNRPRTAARGKVSFQKRSPLMAIFHREMNEVFKTPVYLLNGVMGVLMMPLMLCGVVAGLTAAEEAQALWSKKDELLAMISSLDLTLILSAMFAVNSWIAPVISTAVSREGKRLQITRMIPVSAQTILNAKMLVNIAISGGGSALLAVVLCAVLGVKYVPCVLLAFVLSMLLCYATSAVSLAIDVSRPVLNWKNETQVMKQNMNQIIAMLVSTLMIGLAVAAPLFLLKQGPVWRMLSVVGVLAVQCVVAVLIMRSFAVPRYEKLEP